MRIEDFTNVNEKTSIYSIIWKISLVIAFIGVLSFGYSMLSSTAKVAKKEFGAEAALKKYEWFKDASNEIERKLKDIQVYENKIEKLCSNDKSNNCMIMQEQLFGLISNYNGLVADYNSASSKFNWNLFNTENIPTNYKTK